MFLKFNDVLVRGEKQEPFKRCFNRRYAAVNVSYEYEKRAFSKAWARPGSPNNDRRAPPHRGPCGRSGASVAFKPYLS